LFLYTIIIMIIIIILLTQLKVKDTKFGENTNTCP